MNLRDFLRKLDDEGKLIRVKKEVSAEYEIANVLNSFGERPTIFENVAGYDFQIFGEITSSRDLIADSLGTTKEELLLKLVAALREPREPATSKTKREVLSVRSKAPLVDRNSAACCAEAVTVTCCSLRCCKVPRGDCKEPRVWGRASASTWKGTKCVARLPHY